MVRDGAIVSIIDHERAFYDDPLIEGGFVPVLLPVFGDAAAFMRGYGRGELTTGERERLRLYNFYLMLIVVIEVYYREYAEAGHRVWAHERLDDGLALFGLRRA
jgi:hypothetical protein